jgi:hypothetical protein
MTGLRLDAADIRLLFALDRRDAPARRRRAPGHRFTVTAGRDARA